MLDTITVRAFKSLEDVEVDLGIVNVFVGANGSGKTNLLEAVGVLGAAASGRVDDETLLRRGVRLGLPALYKASFRGGRQPIHIYFAATSDAASYQVSLWNPLEKPKPAWEYKTEFLEESGERIVGRSPASHPKPDRCSGLAALQRVSLQPTQPAARLLDELQQYTIYTPDTATLRGLVQDPQSRSPVGLRGGRLAEAFDEVFRDRPTSEREALYRQALGLIGWSSGLSSSDAGSVPLAASVPRPAKVLRFTDRYMLEGRNVLSAYDASEGALFVLFTLILARHPETPPVCAIDNFDHALNPRLARAVTRQLCDWLLEQSDRQLLLTSHNPLVLDGLPLRDDRVRLFAVDRSVRGKTQVRRVRVDERMLAQAEKGMTLSQQWVMGHFGGVPDNV